MATTYQYLSLFRNVRALGERWTIDHVMLRADSLLKSKWSKPQLDAFLLVMGDVIKYFQELTVLVERSESSRRAFRTLQTGGGDQFPSQSVATVISIVEEVSHSTRADQRKVQHNRLSLLRLEVETLGAGAAIASGVLARVSGERSDEDLGWVRFSLSRQGGWSPELLSSEMLEFSKLYPLLRLITGQKISLLHVGAGSPLDVLLAIPWSGVGCVISLVRWLRDEGTRREAVEAQMSSAGYPADIVESIRKFEEEQARIRRKEIVARAQVPIDGTEARVAVVGLLKWLSEFVERGGRFGVPSPKSIPANLAEREPLVAELRELDRLSDLLVERKGSELLVQVESD